jgi:hypothetical protein
MWTAVKHCIQALHHGGGSQTLLGDSLAGVRARAARIQTAKACTVSYLVYADAHDVFDVTLPPKLKMLEETES